MRLLVGFGDVLLWVITFLIIISRHVTVPRTWRFEQQNAALYLLIGLRLFYRILSYNTLVATVRYNRTCLDLQELSVLMRHLSPNKWNTSWHCVVKSDVVLPGCTHNWNSRTCNNFLLYITFEYKAFVEVSGRSNEI